MLFGCIVLNAVVYLGVNAQLPLLLALLAVLYCSGALRRTWLLRTSAAQ